MSINIKTSTGLLGISGSVTKEKVVSALGYTPATKETETIIDRHINDPDLHVSGSDKVAITNINSHINEDNIHVTPADKAKWDDKSTFSGEFNDLIGKPNITEDDSGEFCLADENGNVIFKANSAGIHSTELTLGSGESTIRVGRKLSAIEQTIEALSGNTGTVMLEIVEKLDQHIEETTQVVEDASNHIINEDIHITEDERTAWNNKSTFSGNYVDLVDKPDITEDDSGAFIIADTSGNKAFEVSATGITKTAQLMIGAKTVDEVIESKLPDIPTWATAPNKPSYNYSEIKDTPPLSSVALSGSYNDLTDKVTKASLSLDQVDNTSDLNKPVSTAQRAALADLKKKIGEQIDSEESKFNVVDKEGYIAFEVDSTGTTNVAKLYSPQTLEANAATASSLMTARKIQLRGALAGSAYFDGSENLVIDTVLNGIDTETLIGATWKADTIGGFALNDNFKAALNFANKVGDFFTGIEISSEESSNIKLGPIYKLTYITTSGNKVVACTATPHERPALPNKPVLFGDYYYVYTWSSTAHQHLYLSGGTDISNPTVIEWLESNGTLVHADQALLGPWHISDVGLASTTTQAILSPTSVKLPQASSTLQVSNVEIAKNSIKGGYEAFTIGNASQPIILSLDTTGAEEKYTATFTSNGWNLFGNQKDFTMTLSPTPVSNFSVIVYWTKYSPGTSSNGTVSGTLNINIYAGTSSYEFSLSNDAMKTNAFGDDYIGLNACSTAQSSDWKTSTQLSAVGLATSQSYHVDQTNTITSGKIVPFANTAQGTLTCSSDIKPSITDYYSLGAANARWKAIYSQTTTIQTSDKNQKNTIQPLTAAHEQVFDALKPVSYKFNKNDSDRTHTGFLAQDIKEAVLAAGLTTKDFAAYCEWETPEGGIECGLRYDELLALCVNEIQKLKQKVAELEEKA